MAQKVEHDVGFLEAQCRKCFQGEVVVAVSDSNEGLRQLRTENWLLDLALIGAVTEVVGAGSSSREL